MTQSEIELLIELLDKAYNSSTFSLYKQNYKAVLSIIVHDESLKQSNQLNELVDDEQL